MIVTPTRSARHFLPVLGRRPGVSPKTRRQVRSLLFLVVLAAVGLLLTWLPLPLAVITVLGAIVFLLLLLYPTWGLVALILVIPFSPLFSLSLGGFSIGGMEALLGLILIAWALQMLAGQRVVVPAYPLLIPWLLWLVVVLASWLKALSLGDALIESLKWLEMLALSLFVVANVKRRHLPWLVAAIVMAGAAQAALGLYQFYWGVGPQGFLLFGDRLLRAYGTFRQPNPYAGYLGLTLPIAYSLALWLSGILLYPGRDTGGKRPWLLAISCLAAWGLVALLLGGLYASQSRGAWIGAAAALVVVSVVRSKRAAVLFGLVLVALAIVGAMGAFDLLPDSLTQRFTDVLPVLEIPNIATAEVTDANFPAIERLAHWQAALDMWRDHLWLGVGAGNYPTIYPAYAIGRWLNPLGHAHNFYLNVAAETGLIGLLAFCLLWLCAFKLAWRVILRSRGFLRAVAVGSLGILVHLCIHNGVDNLFVQGMYLQVAVVLGILAVVNAGPDDRGVHKRPEIDKAGYAD